MAPPRPAEPAKPTLPPSLPEDEALLFEALERWAVDPASWDGTAWGPPPDDENTQVSLEIRRRFFDRIRKREQRRRDAEVAAAKQAEADRQLRDKLLEACHGNFVLGPALDDVAPIRAAMELVDLEMILAAIRSKTDKKLYPQNEAAKSWREPRLLESIAKMFCHRLTTRMVSVWSAAGTAPPKPADALNASPAVQAPQEPEVAPEAPPSQGNAPPDAMAAALSSERGKALEASTAAPHGSLTPADDPLNDAEILFKRPGPPQQGAAKSRRRAEIPPSPTARYQN